MDTFSIIVFSIASSMDNFVVGLSYSKRVKMTIYINFVISIISGLSTYGIMLLGKNILSFIPVFYTNIIGTIVLVAMGLYLLSNYIKNNKNLKSSFIYYNDILKNPEKIDTNNNKNIEFKEALILGIILCLNNLGLGLGASIANLNIVLTAICSAFFSFIFILLGYIVGRKIFANSLTIYSELIASILIIFLGLFQLFK